MMAGQIRAGNDRTISALSDTMVPSRDGGSQMEWLFLLLPWWGFFHLLITFCFYNWHKIIHLKSLTIVLICNTTIKNIK